MAAPLTKLELFDSTLRDGAQGIGISFSLADKLKIIQVLDEAGITYIEAGNPGSNPKDLALFAHAASLPLQHAKLVAFGSTRHKNEPAARDQSLNTLLQAQTPVCCIFGKSWLLHVTDVIGTSEEENLRMIYDSCAYLKAKGKTVIYDAEHFFDGYRDNPDYAIATLHAAVRGGADSICLCDTNGGSLPNQVTAIVTAVTNEISLPLGGHFHNDCGLATANSLAAAAAGATQIQGTFLGFGERCGNANLSELIPTLQLKLNHDCVTAQQLAQLTGNAHAIAAVANTHIARNAPYIGKYAFGHKAGMHADGVLKNASSYEHISPEMVGNLRRFPLSEISGRALVMEKVQKLFPQMTLTAKQAKSILDTVKRLELHGHQFEGAEASFELLVRKKLKPHAPFFELQYYSIQSSLNQAGESIDSAIVKVSVAGQTQLTVAEGNGPVNALDRALRQALELYYPILAQVKLQDYKVRVLDGKSATASTVRVLLTSSYQTESFTTVGVSEDVVAASWKALADSLAYFLLKYSPNILPANNDLADT